MIFIIKMYRIYLLSKIQVQFKKSFFFWFLIFQQDVYRTNKFPLLQSNSSYPRCLNFARLAPSLTQITELVLLEKKSGLAVPQERVTQCQSPRWKSCVGSFVSCPNLKNMIIIKISSSKQSTVFLGIFEQRYKFKILCTTLPMLFSFGDVNYLVIKLKVHYL